MIKLVRLDERMIHGQVAIKWSRHTEVDRIVVLSDEAAGNPIIQKSLMMAAPATVKVAIKSVKDGIKLLQDPRCEKLKILVIVSNPNDLLAVVQQVHDIPLINIGNYGRVASKQGDEPRKTYRSNLYAYDSEVKILEKVMETNVECVYQTTPEDIPEKLKNSLGL
ncbi:PTS system mannose/fructose/N-acetylgalactosamine-transporter subunit IIB [Clostridium fungisolvens]|uniref:PTS EIIB type-4 domain-containing protein n=1 Tax=Clostridium fungisolvens TaxID=1604897 RepID=A0A6V8SHI2_9CLOT|nr:PTS sugar transporter subunit IIB [Clostridium fungisolvens]GFP76440.1 hypothetical protein bsdtw1_02543 [Clostridium fungisolvens]